LKTNKRQIVRFSISGLISTGINFLVYNSLYLVFYNTIFASVIGYSIGLFFSFVFAKIWVFNNNSKLKTLKLFSIFNLIYVLGGIEMSLTIIVLNEFVNNHQIAWFFGALIGSLNNYFGSKYLLFKD